jgi:hypothetical protein
VIFTSQSGLFDRARDAEWDRWYVEHLRIMATVPGISSAQRFKTNTPGFAPSLAMYGVASPGVFDDPYYQSVRGLGEWKSLIDPKYYHRNLFDGLEHAPDVAIGELLLISDRNAPEPAVHGIELTWLECVGLDLSTRYRGIAIVPSEQALAPGPAVAVYRPVTPRISGAS